jgi:hypothetical protein
MISNNEIARGFDMYTFDNNLICDLYKDVYDTRPSMGYMMEWDMLSKRDKQDEWDRLLCQFASNQKLQADRDEKMIADFYSRIEYMMESGAKDQQQAIRWICDADGIDYNDPDVGYICYQLDLPYSMEDVVRG